MNPQVDRYLADGCMRCKYGGTDRCKVRDWLEELSLLRQIVLETGLTEEVKWGVPVYTKNGRNIVTVNALKASANIGFFKGVLLADPHRILQQQGNLQSDRLVRFTGTDEILRLKDVLQAYIAEAVGIEESGAKVAFHPNPEPVPEELLRAFEEDPAFEKAFHALTAGRQRGYILHFSRPKQSATRASHIQRCKGRIFEGLGLHDRDAY